MFNIEMQIVLLKMFSNFPNQIAEKSQANKILFQCFESKQSVFITIVLN